MTTYVQCLPHNTHTTNGCSSRCLTPKVAVTLYSSLKSMQFKKKQTFKITKGLTAGRITAS